MEGDTCDRSDSPKVEGRLSRRDISGYVDRLTGKQPARRFDAVESGNDSRVLSVAGSQAGNRVAGTRQDASGGPTVGRSRYAISRACSCARRCNHEPCPVWDRQHLADGQKIWIGDAVNGREVLDRDAKTVGDGAECVAGRDGVGARVLGERAYRHKKCNCNQQAQANVEATPHE